MKRVVFISCSSGLTLWLAFSSPSALCGQNYQTYREQQAQIATSAKWRLGPFQIYRGIQFRDIGYDGNVYYERQSDLPVSDYTATVSPQLNLYFLYRDWLILSFSENPEFVYYTKEKQERSFNNSFLPSFRLFLVQRFVLSGEFQFQKARVRTSSEFDLRIEEKVEGYNGGIFYETPRGTALGFSGGLKKLSYQSMVLRGQEIDLSRILDREERNGQVELNYKIFSESLLFLRLGYAEYDFKNSESRWKDSFSFSAAGGMRLPFAGRTRGSFFIGYKILTPRRTWIDSFQGLVAGLRLEYRLRPLTVRFQYSRDCQFSYETNNVFYLENWYRAGLSVYLTRFLRLDYDYLFTRLDYPRFIPVWYPDGRYEEILREDFNHSQTAGLVWKVFQDTGIGWSVNLSNRNSNYFWEGHRQRWFMGVFITQDF